MPAEAHEKTPGVYVRAENELPHELDMLWSNSRAYQREERSPLVSFVAGLLVGIVLTAAVFLLFITKPEVQTGANDMLAPVSEDLNTGTPASGSTAAPAAGKTANQPAAAKGSGSTSYKVKSGDTLGSIAAKVYGSSAPEFVDKIQRANNLKSPDSIQLDQELIIPPRNY